MAQGTGTRSGLTNGQGIPIRVREIFWLRFPPPVPGSARPVPPNIGPHFGVVVAVQSPYVVVVYSESNPGAGPQHILYPNTNEAHVFSGVIRNASHFRDDTTALVHYSFIGDHLGTALQVPTMMKLAEVAQAAAISQVAINLRGYVCQPPTPPSPPVPTMKGGGRP